MSNIYVVASKPEGPCKIGFSTNPKARLSSLQTGHPEPLIMWSIWPSPVPVEVEAMAHAHFAEARLMGEWFDITVKEAESFLGRIDEEEDGFRWIATHQFEWPVRLFINRA